MSEVAAKRRSEMSAFWGSLFARVWRFYEQHDTIGSEIPETDAYDKEPDQEQKEGSRSGGSFDSGG